MQLINLPLNLSGANFVKSYTCMCIFTTRISQANTAGMLFPCPPPPHSSSAEHWSKLSWALLRLHRQRLMHPCPDILCNTTSHHLWLPATPYMAAETNVPWNILGWSIPPYLHPGLLRIKFCLKIYIMWRFT